MENLDTWLRFQFFIAGKLTATDWVDCSQPNAKKQAEVIRKTHELLVERAEDQGLLWMSEIFDPEEEPENAYLRMGTDASLMVKPRKLNI